VAGLTLLAIATALTLALSKGPSAVTSMALGGEKDVAAQVEAGEQMLRLAGRSPRRGSTAARRRPACSSTRSRAAPVTATDRRCWPSR
jgi:hypothetical protein